jgi:predicted phage terminase large subunit-like protein
LLCDPASEKKKDNDYTVMAIIGTGDDQNYYVVDFIRDRLNLTERTKWLLTLHRTYRPTAVGYEKYGKDSDIEHIEYVQEHEHYRFPITELSGAMPKNDRIRRLIPAFEQGRFYIPARHYFVDYQRKQRDLTREFIDEEYTKFPVGDHDDILDCFARIMDPELLVKFPQPVGYKGNGEFQGFSNIIDRSRPQVDGRYREIYAG